MALRVGFAEVDITPPVGTHKIGWIIDIVSDRVLDPLFARAAIFATETRRVAFIQLDTLSVRWTTVSDIRQRIEGRYGFPGCCVMVAATHNHAGPAVASCGDVRRDDTYVGALVGKVVSMFGEALGAAQKAELGTGSCFEFRLSHNRRIIMRDGTVRTHGHFTDPLALCFEGPIDPEVAVMAARDRSGRTLGAVVNFACHPTHHGGERSLSAGYPGVLAREMRARGCPVTLFLNGACGNVHHADPTDPERTDRTKEDIGRQLAEDVEEVLAAMQWRAEAKLGHQSETVQLPFRKVTEEEVRGTARGAQRFVDPAAYDRHMPRLVESIRRMETQPAEVQALFIDDWAYVGIPAEYFVQHGLRIKEQSYPRHVVVVGHANGMVGYVPHREAFFRGGYETTFGLGSRLAPEAGDILADCAVRLVREGPET